MTSTDRNAALRTATPAGPLHRSTGPGSEVTAVCVGLLCDGISLTTVRDARGWRFYSWTDTEDHDEELQFQPTFAERQRHFDTPKAASAYFKQTYAIHVRALRESAPHEPSSGVGFEAAAR